MGAETPKYRQVKLAEVSTRVMDQLADGVVQGSMGRDGEDAGQLKLGADTQESRESGQRG